MPLGQLVLQFLKPIFSESTFLCLRLIALRIAPFLPNLPCKLDRLNLTSWRPFICSWSCIIITSHSPLMQQFPLLSEMLLNYGWCETLRTLFEIRSLTYKHHNFRNSVIKIVLYKVIKDVIIVHFILADGEHSREELLHVLFFSWSSIFQQMAGD